MNVKDNGGFVKIIVLIIVILLILIVGAGAMIKFDVFSLGTQVVGPAIKDVPLLNMILPEMPEELSEADMASYNFETVEEAVEVLKITENMLKESAEEAEKISEQLTQLTAEVERLKVFEGNQLQFEADQKTFDDLVASNAEAIVFEDWFEKMNPENAAEIYAQVIEEVKYDEDLKGLVDIYQSMKPAQAASILEDMTITQLDLVSKIIKNLSADQSADILGGMEAATAAKITTYISPQK